MKTIVNDVKFNKCPLCGSKKISYIGIIDYVKQFSSEEILLTHVPEYWKCITCKSSFVNNVIPKEVAENLYKNNNGIKWRADNISEIKTKTVLKILKENIKKESLVLDIGCNYGELLDFAKQQNAITYGIEISSEAKTVAEKNGHTIFNNLQEIQKNISFDTILLFDVIEHLYELKSFFESCYKILKPEGKLIILTGNPNCLSAILSKNKWWYISFPEHIIFPSKKYFKNIDSFYLRKYIKVFNSINYEQNDILSIKTNMFSNLKNFIKKLKSHAYDGIPLLGCDHSLVILEKK